MANFKVEEDNTEKILEKTENAILKSLEIIGIKAEKYAKALCPVGTPESTGIKGYKGGTLRGSITHEVNKVDYTVTIGSNVEYAPYVELGTGPNFKAPPQWEQFDVPAPKGKAHGYVRPRPYLQPALKNHLSDYRAIIENELKNS